MPEPAPVDPALPLAAKLAKIEALPLEQRAEAFSQLYERLREQLEDADANVTNGQA